MFRCFGIEAPPLPSAFLRKPRHSDRRSGGLCGVQGVPMEANRSQDLLQAKQHTRKHKLSRLAHAYKMRMVSERAWRVFPSPMSSQRAP